MNDIFRKLLVEVEKTSKPERKQQIVDQFANRLSDTNYPIFENDSTVVLLYKGKAENVYLLGDMGNWVEKLPMTNISGTDLFWFRGMYESTAHLEYWILIDNKEEPMIDPLNPNIVRNGLGKISELVMPKYNRNPIFEHYIKGEIGEFPYLVEGEILSNYLNYSHRLDIYFPKGYNSSNENYPVLYFQDGKDYIEFAVVPEILNHLIASNVINPCIAVFVTPPNLHKPVEPNRSTEYGLNNQYVSFFAEELVNFVDHNYRTIKKSESRFIIGDSYGGLISTYIALTHPEIFGNVYSQSGYFSFNNDQIIKMINEKDKRNLKLVFDVGTYEREVGAQFIPEHERDFLEANRRMRDASLYNDYNIEYSEYFEGHTWGNWRNHLVGVIKQFLKKERIS